MGGSEVGGCASCQRPKDECQQRQGSHDPDPEDVHPARDLGQNVEQLEAHEQVPCSLHADDEWN